MVWTMVTATAAIVREPEGDIRLETVELDNLPPQVDPEHMWRGHAAQVCSQDA